MGVGCRRHGVLNTSGLFMVVADHPRKLSAATLYLAKWTQTSDIGPGAGDISWIKLGHATSDEIKPLVNGGIKAADIVDVKTNDPGDISHTKIRFNGTNNWIKLMPGMEKAATFLEFPPGDPDKAWGSARMPRYGFNPFRLRRPDGLAHHLRIESDRPICLTRQ